MDRRFALMIACVLIVLLAWTASQIALDNFVWVVVVFALWADATESIFSIGNAHANDRADPQYYVSLSSTLLVAWSVSGLIVPALATALTPLFGPRVFMYLAIVIAAAYLAFVLIRTRQREAAPHEDTTVHKTVSAQVPLTPELSANPPEESR